MAEWVQFLVRNIDPDTLRRLIEDADEQGRSLSDYIRAILCDHYELVCDPSGSPPKRRRGDVQTILLRMQPELFHALAEDRARQERSMQSVVHEILELHYMEVPAS